MDTLKLGIVGKGFVGGSVSFGFDRNVEQIIVDPKHSDITLEECVAKNPNLIFICVPSPQGEDGDVDVTIANNVLLKLDNLKYGSIVVVKSTITPHHLVRFKHLYEQLNIVYNPEFLTEANAHWDFCNPPMQILGGYWENCEQVERAYLQHSSVKVVPTFKTDIITASLLKYTINSWLATKVTFMNELYVLHKELRETGSVKTTWEQFTDMLSRDPRIGNSHLQVPGPDGHFGFGGHCFPKDTSALVFFADEVMKKELSVLQQAVNKNKETRNEESNSN